jgi:hypothetical protein
MYNPQLHIEIFLVQEGYKGQNCREMYFKQEYQVFFICILTRIEGIQDPNLMYSKKIVFLICDFFFKPQ